MESELKQLEARAFQSWETEMIPRLMDGNRLIRLGCATFTMKKAKHRHPVQFQTMMDRYFSAQARKMNRHIVWFFGETAIGAQEKVHQHGDIFLLQAEGAVSFPDDLRWVLSSSFQYGRCLIEAKSQGNWSGYSLAKHDGTDELLKVYCPKTGRCGNHTKRKGDRRVCVYQRDQIRC